MCEKRVNTAFLPSNYQWYLYIVHSYVNMGALIEQYSLNFHLYVAIYSSKKELGTDVYTAVHFLFAYIKAAGLSQDILETLIPEVILYQLEYLSNKVTN